jgi:hypothetical protein
MTRRLAVSSALLVLLATLVVRPAAAQASTAPSTPRKLRIALVPLDDRPVCLQYPRMMAGLAHAEIVAPPMDLLGRFTTPGDTDGIARWLRAQNWRGVDALIVSTDMLAYGGLVASRVHEVDQRTALARLGVLAEIRSANARLPIYGFSVIMRLAPTADGTNEAWRDELARWAELAHGRNTDAETQELATLERDIPADALANYTRARSRNRRVNLEAIDFVRRKVIDHLVVSQDDARPRGVHLADRHEVTRSVRDAQLGDRVGIQPGADEVAMLLLARAVLEAHGVAPTVRAIYSTERARTMVAPFEDRQLHETVSFQLTAAGASESTRGTSSPDLDLFVFASRHDAGAPRAFAADVVSAVEGGARAIVADVDPKGDVQGGAAAFTEPLLAAEVFPKLYGYASWNTAGNTLGTAIPHGVLAWAGARLAARCTSPAWSALAAAQATFMLHRLVNDYAYQGVLRPAINADLRQSGGSALSLSSHAPEVASRIQEALAPKLADYARQFTSRTYGLPAQRPTDVRVQVGAPRDLRVRLPWDRTFEAMITFDVPTAAVSGPARRLPACTTTPQ